ncbi:MAG TPA: D-2-hydroxyacid dehydrogenase [Candidatus Limnocylindria bacterium]|nr:D-2-hydroxyacid dehydrogenase [Candidatus Limnocylindria bacterium]
MNIVVLDGYTLNPGDLNWDALKQLGPCTIHDRTPPELVLERASDAEVLLTNKTVLTRETILSLSKLKYIGVLATGYNIVDVAAAKERGIPVTNGPDYGTPSVAQFTIALLLELTQHVGHHAQTMREGRWVRSADFCYWDFPLVELHGLAFGVIGFGKIGRAVAKLADAFGMKVLVRNRSRPAELPAHFELLSLDDLLSRSDVVSLHCPLTRENKQFINAERLARMKPSAFLLNTSRGPLLDEPAVAEALNTNRIAGAGLDVLSVEPPKAENLLLTAKNCIITPHIAWATRAARSRLMNIAVENIRAFVSGSARNVVNA